MKNLVTICILSLFSCEKAKERTVTISKEVGWNKKLPGDLSIPKSKINNNIICNVNINSYLKEGFQLIDEINADLDGDSDDDKIYLASSQEEITNLQVLIFRNNNNSFILWTRNDSFPILGQKEYKRTVTKGNYFTIEYYRDIEEKYNLNNYLTFKFNNNNFILYKFSQETYDVTNNKMLPVKIWTEKNFGTLTFDKVTYNFIDGLK